MVEEDRLTGSLATGGAPSYGSGRDIHGDLLDGVPPTPMVGGTTVRPRSQVLYWVLASFLTAGAIVVHRTALPRDADLHTLLEAVSATMAVVVGASALVRFFSKKRVAFLILGTGFLGTFVLDAHHLIRTSWLSGAQIAPGFEDLAAWTWLAGRLLLAVTFYLSWVGWRWEQWRLASHPIEERPVFVGVALLVVGILLILTFAPLPRANFPEFFIHRPGEFLPALFFFLALAGYSEKRAWRTDPVEHWIIISLILAAFGQGVFMAFSDGPYDAVASTAVALKLSSFIAVEIGLLVSVYQTSRERQVAYAQSRQANAALVREVAVRREAERVLRESEERYQDLLDNAHDLIQSSAPNGQILYANRAWKETLGYDDEDLAELNVFHIVHPDFQDQFRKTFHRVVSGELVTDVEIGFVSAEGELVICRGSSNCRFENGVPVATRSILRDVTEERRAARELEASEANLSALVESTGDAIWSVDRNHELITFNSAYALEVEALTGREPRAGDRPETLVASGEAGWLRDLYDRALQGSRFTQVWSLEVDGEQRSFELFFNPVLSRSGTSGVVVYSRDVTPRMRTEEALRVAKEAAESANRAKSQFLASMSHELRTPLNSVIGFANLLLKRKSESLSDHESSYLQRILANGKHLLVLINEFLDLAKIEAGRMELDIQEVDLMSLVQETLSQLEAQVRDKPVILRADVPQGTTSVLTDGGKLKQVLINLVGNGIKFTEEGEVRVSVEVDEETSAARSITVSDTGMGIPSDRLQSIFEAFEQGDGGTSRRFGGTGLGLTISRSICQLLGYDLRVESEVGKGSSFIIHLSYAGEDAGGAEKLAEPGKGPVSRAAASSDTRAHEPAPAAVPSSDADVIALIPSDRPLDPEMNGAPGQPVVLVVDDDPASRVLMRSHLKELGCHVLSARSGEAALKLARERVPDLITLDLMMPGMSGWEVLGRLKQDRKLREIPVVVATAARHDGKDQFLGRLELLQKPVSREQLYQVLHRCAQSPPRRVLVVDDDASTRALVRTFLEESGLEIQEAEDGHQALYQLTRFRPDVIVLDLMMPVMDGVTFLNRIRETPAYRGLPVVVLTARKLSNEEFELLERKVWAQFVKDADLRDRLREALEECLGPPVRVATEA